MRARKLHRYLSVPAFTIAVFMTACQPEAPTVETAQTVDSGAALFKKYCASCHGIEGRGDGPAAPALSPPPSDLTRLTTSLQDLMQQIDGRRTIRAHGTAAMPVWGEVFEQSLLDREHKRRTALLQVQALAEYTMGLR